ncbi:hypothetical protein PSTT_09295 [Puccinia striiformis]|uniref:Uncharacterized protein n=1 Tax=Puccinia striiformis TaxID=27350 RepID=A0A2S4V916_9BASI|nr:hypothetical protein PSTT_09295 [Puccinia striiformis]
MCLSEERVTSGNTRPQPGILDQPADLDLIFSTLIINDSPIHQQRSGRPSKASRSRSYSRNRSSDQTVIKDSINTDAINSDLDRPGYLATDWMINLFRASGYDVL